MGIFPWLRKTKNDLLGGCHDSLDRKARTAGPFPQNDINTQRGENFDIIQLYTSMDIYIYIFVLQIIIYNIIYIIIIYIYNIK